MLVNGFVRVLIDNKISLNVALYRLRQTEKYHDKNQEEMKDKLQRRDQFSSK